MKLSTVLSEELRDTRPVKVLDRSLEKGRLAHGILLHGGSLAALEDVALGLSACLLDEEVEGGDFTAIRKHPDLFTLRPSNKMRQINAENTRELIRSIVQSPNRAHRKVALIYEADRMHTTAANIFLKTLEEPPADTTILLLTTRPYDLLDTIRSRCFNFRLPIEKQQQENEAWTRWLANYGDWIASLYSGVTTAQDRTAAIMRLYGLASGFQSILDAMAGEAWSAMKAELDETVTDEEKLALEAGNRRGLRQSLLAEVEKATRDLTVKMSSQGKFASRELAAAVQEIESASGLLELNLKEEAALESYLLACLRLWTNKGRS